MPDVLPHSRGRTSNKIQVLPTYYLSREGDRCTGRPIQHSVVVCMMCIRSEINIACAGRMWEGFLLKIKPALNFEGPIKVGKLKKGEG